MPWHTDLVAVAELRPPGKLFFISRRDSEGRNPEMRLKKLLAAAEVLYIHCLLKKLASPFTANPVEYI